MFHFSRAFHWLDDRSHRISTREYSRGISDFLVTRRRFLIGSAAASAGAVIPSGSPGDLKVFASRDRIVVELNQLSWKIDRSTFGAAARIRYWKSATTHSISVKRSFPARAGLSTDFFASLQVVRGQWWLSVRMMGAEFEMPLDAWLEGKYLARASVPQLTGSRIGTLGSSLEWMSSAATIEITPDWQVHWQSDKPILTLRIDGLALTSREARLTLGPDKAGGTVDVLAGAKPLNCATLDIISPEISEAVARPGRVGPHELSLKFDAIRRAQLVITAQRDGAPQAIISTVGEAEASVVPSSFDGSATAVLSGLRLAPVGLVAPIFQDSGQRLLVARITAAAHTIDTPDVVLSVAGQTDDGIATVFMNGVSPPLEIAAELHAVDVPVSGADAGHIHFSPIPLSIVIGRDGPPDEGPVSALGLVAYHARRDWGEYLPALTPVAVTAQTSEEKKPDPPRALMVLDKSPFFAAPLDKGQLHVLRSQDLLSLKFGFRNFSVEVRHGKATLIPRPITHNPLDTEKFVHKLIVEFPPQHVAEDATKTQLGLSNTPVSLDQRTRTGDPAPRTPVPPSSTDFPVVARARLSGPTRLVFRIKDEDKDNLKKNLMPKNLSVKTLTEWSELAQVVSERAMTSDTPLLDQLNMVGIGRTTNRAEALVKVIQSIRRPREDVTAIEFPYRLILSPDNRARWITPQHDLKSLETPTLLWNARLDPAKGGKSVRAIWARDLLLDFLRGNMPADRDQGRIPNEVEISKLPPPPPSKLPLNLSLSRSDRRELVVLSSVYGLPALRRIVLDKDVALGATPPQPDKNQKPDSAGTVLPFPPGFGLWDQGGSATVADEGIYVPKPMMAADLSLTAMGGTFVGEGQWEPPSPIVNDSTLNSKDPDIADNWKPSLRLERWKHRAVLGRDIYVEVAYKGFLFPIGHRASLLKVTERRFFPHPDTKRSTAYLIQRLFIVIGKREKYFPSIGQPFDGRLWPFRLATMATGRTPDLVDPEVFPFEEGRKNGRLLFENKDPNVVGKFLNGLVFWPRIASYNRGAIQFNQIDGAKNNINVSDGNEVNFQFRKDDSPEPISAPFVFVDNVAAHEPKTMAALVNSYYNLLPDDSPLRRATHGGVRHRYAQSIRDGETDFNTQSWDLNASGRYLDDPATLQPVETYRVDGIMEGADQPPYYPVVRTGNINVQSVDRLVGAPAGGMSVAFNELYVRHAFAREQNPSELFLDVLRPAINLDFSGGGDVVGGLAKPNTRLVALSRKFGPVGGRAPPPSGSGNGLRLRSAAAPASSPSSIPGLDGLPPRGDSAAFSAGRFDPREFLGGANSLPKLLGIFSLSDILKVVAFADGGSSAEKESKVPKLQENVSFGGGGVDLGEQIARAKAVINKTFDAFVGGGSGGIIGTALKEIDDAIEKLNLGPDFNWRALYPRLAGAFAGLIAALKDAKDKADHTNDVASLLEAASGVVAAGKALITEAKAVQDNPMPPLVSGILLMLQQEWEKVRRFAKVEIDGTLTDLNKIVGDFKEGIVGQLNSFRTGIVSKIDLLPIIEFIFDAGPDVDYVFSEATDDNDPGTGKLRLGSATQNAATVVRLGLNDAYGASVTLLLDGVVEGISAGRGFLRLAHSDDSSKCLFFTVSAVAAPKGYRNLTVASVLPTAPSPFHDKDPVRLTFIPFPDFKAADAASVSKRMANALLYEVAGEPLARAHAALRDLATELSGEVDQNAREIGAKLLAVAAKVFDAALALARAAETSGVMDAVSSWCTDATNFAIDVSNDLIETDAILAGHLFDVGTALDQIKPPELTPPDIHVKLDQARAAAAQAQERLAKSVVELRARRAEISKFRDHCPDINRALTVSGKIFALRRDAVAALQDLILQARMIAAAIDEIPPTSVVFTFAGADRDVQAARDAVKKVVQAVIDFVQDVTSVNKASKITDTTVVTIEAKIKQLSDQLANGGNRYKAELAEITAAVANLKASAAALNSRAAAAQSEIKSWANGGAPFPPDIAALGSDILTYAMQHDRRLAALVLQSSATFRAAQKLFEDTAANILGLIAKPLVAVHDVAINAMAAVSKRIDATVADPDDQALATFLTAILSKDVVNAFTKRTLIAQDRKDLNTILTGAGAAGKFPAAFDLRDRWSKQDPGLVSSVKELARIVESLAHGQLSAIINLDGVRALIEEQLKDALLDFLPTKVELSYAWNTELQKFADIFEMQHSDSHDLTLSANVSIDLLNPQSRVAKVTGIIKPFKVHILGKQGDTGSFLSIIFNGASFSSVNGGRPDFKADIDDIVIGPLLEFIQQLSSYLSYGGSGFFVKLTLFPLGIEAGFEFNEKVVSLGAITFFNVGFSISAQLPFQDRDARIRMALASAMDPLMLSVLPCYGGGGFFGITSNGREIVEAECSAEFGAIVGASFGPLTAVVRVMAGIYIRQASGGGAYIKGFVHAIGEGCIACFSITVNIEVAIIQENGNMRGESSYRFTFKVAFAEISYGVTASYSISGSGGGSTAATAVAFIDDVKKAHPNCGAALENRHVTIRVPSKSRRWSEYRKRVDLSLLGDAA